MADKIGLKKMLIFGISIFSIVYFGMGFKQNIYVFAGIFALYGIYAAATEGVSKAWISNISNERILRLLSVPILLFKAFFTMLASSMAG
jgi:MFS family permease